jgi:hypothetical protein
LSKKKKYLIKRLEKKIKKAQFYSDANENITQLEIAQELKTREINEID